MSGLRSRITRSEDVRQGATAPDKERNIYGNGYGSRVWDEDR
jgi:hypothetical protein